jgi:hypothetical protein
MIIVTYTAIYLVEIKIVEHSASQKGKAISNISRIRTRTASRTSTKNIKRLRNKKLKLLCQFNEEFQAAFRNIYPTNV